MTNKQRIHFFATWNKCCKFLQSSGNYTKSECEEERQTMLKHAGAKPDEKGRYSANTLTNAGVSTCLDYMDTSILNKPNKKRRSNDIIYTIKKLGLSDDDLNKISRDQFRTDDWQKLSEQDLTKLRYTAARTARQRKKKTQA